MPALARSCLVFFSLHTLIAVWWYLSIFFERGYKFYFVMQWSKKNTNKKVLLLSLIKKEIRHKAPMVSGNVTFIVPLPLVCKRLVEFYFTHLNAAEKCHMKKTSTPGSNSSVLFYWYRYTIYTTTHEIELHPSSCTVLREMAAVSVMCVLL